MNKTRISVYIDNELIEEAKLYEINVSKAARNGIRLAIERETQNPINRL